jgi:large subunit ribosomal protein L10
MRAEKQLLTTEYVARLNASPYFLVIDYRGLNVGQFAELRRRLSQAGAEVHVIKNSVFERAAQAAAVADLGGGLAGQLAVVTGRGEVTAAAKALKTFQAEFDKPKMRFGGLGNRRLEKDEVWALAELPPLAVLRARLLGVMMAPATRLARLLKTPAAQLARVLQARAEKGQAAAEPAIEVGAAPAAAAAAGGQGA